MSNTRLWDKLGKTDPSATKAFTRAGGFKGTAIRPMWAFKRMTEEFGPCGIGWGVNEPSFQVVPGSEGEVLVYCTVSVWCAESLDSNSINTPVFGVGGDKVVTKDRNGLRSDDEAFKKAYTDAITNALKLIGVGADVHMGLFDDNKYVRQMEEEFAPEQEPPPHNPPQSKRNSKDASRKTYGQLQEALRSRKTLEDLKSTWESFMGEIKQLPLDWEAELTKLKNECKAEIMKADEDLKQIKAPSFENMEPNNVGEWLDQNPNQENE